MLGFWSIFSQLVSGREGIWLTVFHVLYKLWGSEISNYLVNFKLTNTSKYIRLCWPMEREWLKFFLEGFNASWFFSPNFTDSELFIWPYFLLPQIQLPLFSDFPFSSLNLWHRASKRMRENVSQVLHSYSPSIWSQNICYH